MMLIPIAGEYTLRKGNPLYCCHIPSNGPLNRENILDSLEKASKYFKQSPIVVSCDSWLLFPPVRNMVDSSSGIATFCDMFHITKVIEQEGYPDAWRIYGAFTNSPITIFCA